MPIVLDTTLINNFGNKLVADIGASLDSSGSTASGATKRSLRFEYGGNSFKLYGRAYIGALEFGRKPTSNEGGDGSLRAAILQWIDDKGLILKEGQTKESLSWAISKKIHEQGDLLHRTNQNYQKMPKPTQIINGVINDGRIKALGQSLLFQIVKSTQLELKDAYNDTN